MTRRSMDDITARAAEKELADAVRSAHEHSLSWREVGEALGSSGEAARRRYGALA